jgi:hypothetical protein
MAMYATNIGMQIIDNAIDKGLTVEMLGGKNG